MTQETRIELAKLLPCKTNPRSSITDESVAELAASIEQHGILQPLVVSTTADGRGRHTIIAGHRRHRAAKLAKLDEVPVVFRDLDAKAIAEVQIVENLQRRDLDELDEADGYGRLIDEHGHNAQSIADAIGKSKAYVYGRLKLRALCEPVRALVTEGKLPASHALLVARIPGHDRQLEAAEEIVAGEGWGKRADDPLSYRASEDLIADKYQRPLKEAPFNVKAEDLVEDRGPCADCPMRSGNLEDYVKSQGDANVCTDLGCWDRKAEAAHKAKIADAKKKGGGALPAKEREKLCAYGHYHGYEAEKMGLLDLSSKHRNDRKNRNYRTLLGKDAPAKRLLQDPQTGRTIELVDKKEAERIVLERHPELKPQGRGKAKLTKAELAKRDEALAEKDGTRRALGQVAELAVLKMGAEASAELWRPVAVALVDGSWSDCCREVVKRRGWEGEGSASDTVAEQAEALDGPALVGLIVELVMTKASQFGWDEGQGAKAWKGLCKTLKVDPASHTKAALAEIESKRAAKAPAKKKPVLKRKKKATKSRTMAQDAAAARTKRKAATKKKASPRRTAPASMPKKAGGAS